jgi:ubiquinone/menaquinone biosynthesis C-methylase UbiE
MTFYDELSSFYDQMISFESRLENERKIFKTVMDRFPANTILDAGCGSGYHSILLSSFGKDVTGFDPSGKMIELAKNNIKRYKSDIDFYKTDFLGFPEIISKKFDALFSLGNSFVHLTTTEDILKALKKFYNILNPGGYVCIGIINYDRILKTGNMEISKKDKNGLVYHRYYTFNEKTVTFHVDISGKENHHFETELYPLTSQEFSELSFKVGFKNIQLYGNMKLDEYNQYESENIVAFFQK